MANEIGRINRKIKSAMKRFINNEDDRAFPSIIKLAKEREELLKLRRFVSKHDKSEKR